MVKRHPHTAVITWKDVGTKNGDGVYTEGAEHTVTIACNIQPKTDSYITKPDGDRIDYSYVIFCELFSGASSIKDNAHIAFLSTSLKVIQVDVYQKHIEIRC